MSLHSSPHERLGAVLVHMELFVEDLPQLLGTSHKEGTTCSLGGMGVGVPKEGRGGGGREGGRPGQVSLDLWPY